MRAIECKEPYGHAARPWASFAILESLEKATGNAAAAEGARAQATAAYLAYRRAGGENHTPGGRLAAMVAQALASAEVADVASRLAELGGQTDLPHYLQALVPVLRKIVEGSRDPTLASTPGLDYDDAAEVTFLLEHLG